MGWIIVFIVVCLLGLILDSALGKLVLIAATLAIGALLLRWITGFAFFAVLAKICAVVIVLAIVGAIVMAIAD